MLGPDAAVATGAVAARLADADAGVRWRAAFALAMLHADAVPALRPALHDKAAAVRLWALRAVLSGDAPPRERTALVLSWLDDDRTFVRKWALDVAAKLGKDAAPAAPRLVQLLREPGTSGAAAELLQRLGPDAAAA